MLGCCKELSSPPVFTGCPLSFLFGSADLADTETINLPLFSSMSEDSFRIAITVFAPVVDALLFFRSAAYLMCDDTDLSPFMDKLSPFLCPVVTLLLSKG